MRTQAQCVAICNIQVAISTQVQCCVNIFVKCISSFKLNFVVYFSLDMFFRDPAYLCLCLHFFLLLCYYNSENFPIVGLLKFYLIRAVVVLVVNTYSAGLCSILQHSSGLLSCWYMLTDCLLHPHTIRL